MQASRKASVSLVLVREKNMKINIEALHNPDSSRDRGSGKTFRMLIQALQQADHDTANVFIVFEHRQEARHSMDIFLDIYLSIYA